MKNNLCSALVVVAMCMVSIPRVEARLQVETDQGLEREAPHWARALVNTPQLLNPEVLGQIPYPQLCRELGIQGKVKLMLLVGRNGKVIQGKVVNAPHAELGEACLAFLESLQFIPGTTDEGEPLESWVSIVINFQLDS